MNFDQFFDSCEQDNQTKKNKRHLYEILLKKLNDKGIHEDISINFDHPNVDLLDYLTGDELQEIFEEYCNS